VGSELRVGMWVECVRRGSDSKDERCYVCLLGVSGIVPGMR
jgi:hypothetical protein